MPAVNVNKNTEQLDFSCVAGGNINRTAILKNIWPSLTELSMHSPYNPGTALLGLYPWEMKSYVHPKSGDICSQQLDL